MVSVNIMLITYPTECYTNVIIMMTKVSSTNLCQNLGGWEQCLELFVLSTPCIGWPQWADWGTHGSTLNLFIELVLERKVGILETKLQ